MPSPRPPVIGYHLIFTGYGHWLPNDPRGSGSSELRNDGLSELGPVHFGRKRVQPGRGELRRFFGQAEARLQHPLLWFDQARRARIAEGFGRAIRAGGYTCYACAVLPNHAHALIRRHRDDAETMCTNLAIAATESFLLPEPALGDHPVWGRDNHKIFKDSVDSMWACVQYIEQNPAKHHLPPQAWDFVTSYDGWPRDHKRR